MQSIANLGGFVALSRDLPSNSTASDFFSYFTSVAAIFSRYGRADSVLALDVGARDPEPSVASCQIEQKH
jgi:hypothetical protein